jgi:hypothetical protein
MWQRVTGLNRIHPRWAWTSLGSVVLADAYVRLVAVGAIGDLAIRF